MDRRNKQQVLEKILSSPELGDSKKNQTLLRYLAEHSINDKPVKETAVAIDLFGKDASFNPVEDPIVRVSVGNLRKKLEHYYLTGGKEDTIRLEIPKGHYHVQFAKAAPPESVPGKAGTIKRFRLVPVSIVLFVALAVFALLHFWPLENRQKPRVPDDHPIWGGFLRSTLPTTIVLGDYFFLYERKPELNRGFYVRDPRINSFAEYREILKKDPQFIKKYLEADLTYISPGTVFGMADVLSALASMKNRPAIKLASNLKWEEIQRYNYIFIGTFKTLYILNELLQPLGVKWNIAPSVLFFQRETADSLHTYSMKSGQLKDYSRDYAFVAKFLGPHNNNILLLTGFGEMGVIEGSKAVTDPQFLKQIENRYLRHPIRNPLYFKLVLETEGINRTAFKTEIKEFQEIKNSMRK